MKAQDIGALRGIQEQYGMAGSGQEMYGLEKLMGDYNLNSNEFMANLQNQQNQQLQSGLQSLYNINQQKEQTLYERKTAAKNTRIQYLQGDMANALKFYEAGDQKAWDRYIKAQKELDALVPPEEDTVAPAQPTPLPPPQTGTELKQALASTEEITTNLSQSYVKALVSGDQTAIAKYAPLKALVDEGAILEKTIKNSLSIGVPVDTKTSARFMEIFNTIKGMV
jgi:hypothetical protein